MDGVEWDLTTTDLAELVLHAARRNVDRATEHVRVDNWSDYVVSMGAVVTDVAFAAKLRGVDLCAAIEIKMAYNETRPARHGGKQA
jgi:hypothetical protein